MRPTLGGKAVTGKKASLNMAYTDPIKDDRNDADSREFCVACHGSGGKGDGPGAAHSRGFPRRPAVRGAVRAAGLRGKLAIANARKTDTADIFHRYA